MRIWVFLALPMLSACMGGMQALVLSGAPDIGGAAGGITVVPEPVTGDLGHVSFSLLLNDERAAGGIREVAANPLLSRAAQSHAVDMVENSYFSHTDLEGGRASDRVEAVGYDWDFIAENLAQGFGTERSVIDAWMASPGHRDNIMDARAEEFGLGREDSTWVLLLGRQAGAPASP